MKQKQIILFLIFLCLLQATNLMGYEFFLRHMIETGSVFNLVLLLLIAFLVQALILYRFMKVSVVEAMLLSGICNAFAMMFIPAFKTISPCSWMEFFTLILSLYLFSCLLQIVIVARIYDLSVAHRGSLKQAFLPQIPPILLSNLITYALFVLFQFRQELWSFLFHR